jgi:ABC-type sugar transport system ATPase subunit
MRGIGKRFGAIRVLADVDFEAWRGEVHVLAGENGAGKSTLIKILGGAHADYEGTIEIDGVVVRPRTPREAAALGIAVIHQELSLVPTLGAADNLFLGRWPTGPLGLVRGRAQREAALRALQRFGLDVDPDRPVGELSPATRQLIEIAKALDPGRSQGDRSRVAGGPDSATRVIVMDEPTSALTGPDVAELHARLGDLRAHGIAIVYITHRMEEIEQVGDRITVLRDGRRVGSAPASEVPASLLLRWMGGREAPEPYRRAAPPPVRFENLPDRLRVDDLTVVARGRRAVDSVSLDVRAGEIVGLAGLQGSGASEVLLGLFGALGEAATAVALRIDDESVTIGDPRDAIARGIALLTNDRQASGLVLPMSVAGNLTLPSLRALSPGGIRRPAAEAAIASELMRALAIRAASPDIVVRNLSGGNQQKVALGKWLSRDMARTGRRANQVLGAAGGAALELRLLLLDEPTRGVDVGAKREIYRLLDGFTARGIGVLLASSDLPELLALSDRIVVLHRGRVTARLARGEATPDSVLEAAMGERGGRTVDSTTSGDGAGEERPTDSKMRCRAARAERAPDPGELSR